MHLGNQYNLNLTGQKTFLSSLRTISFFLALKEGDFLLYFLESFNDLYRYEKTFAPIHKQTIYVLKFIRYNTEKRIILRSLLKEQYLCTLTQYSTLLYLSTLTQYSTLLYLSTLTQYSTLLYLSTLTQYSTLLYLSTLTQYSTSLYLSTLTQYSTLLYLSALTLYTVQYSTLTQYSTLMYLSII